MLRIALLLASLFQAPPIPSQPPPAESPLLEAFDEGLPIPELPAKPAPEPSLRWLHDALRNEALKPTSPFAKGTPEFEETRALLAWLGKGSEPAQLSLRLTGSQVLFWRWGAARARQGGWDRAARQAWEDRLLQAGVHGLMREYALRHALCFALADKDELRFASLKARWEEEAPRLFPGFQRAFALLGRPLPRLRLWALPGLSGLDESLAGKGFRVIRIEVPPEGGPLATPDPDTAWLLPSREGQVEANAAELDPATLLEAQGLAARTPAGARTLYLAPSRASLETYGLTFFPARLDLDSEGLVKGIYLGDAARAKR